MDAFRTPRGNCSVLSPATLPRPPGIWPPDQDMIPTIAPWCRHGGWYLLLSYNHRSGGHGYGRIGRSGHSTTIRRQRGKDRYRGLLLRKDDPIQSYPGAVGLSFLAHDDGRIKRTFGRNDDETVPC